MSCHAIARSVYQPSRVCNWAIPEINGTPPIEELGIPKNCGPFLPWESPPPNKNVLFIWNGYRKSWEFPKIFIHFFGITLGFLKNC